MGKFNTKLVGTVSAAILLLAPVANADLIAQISDTADFSGAIIEGIDTDGDGMVNVSGGFRNWRTNIAIGFSSPMIGTDRVDVIHLNSFNVSSGAGTIYIRLSDEGFDKNYAPFNTAFGGTTDGSVSFQSYADASNLHFGQETLLSDSSLISNAAYSSTDSGNFSMADPYSMSIYASITHESSGQMTGFNYNVKVPEPSSLALLGLGLIGIGFASRYKAKKSA